MEPYTPQATEMGMRATCYTRCVEPLRRFSDRVEHDAGSPPVTVALGFCFENPRLLLEPTGWDGLLLTLD